MKRGPPDGSGFRVYHNVWFHNFRWFALMPHDQVDIEDAIEDGLSVGNTLTRMPVVDLPAYAAASRLSFVPGLSALVDYPFQSLPEHLGHWTEVMVPLYSVLMEGNWQALVQGRGGEGKPPPALDQLVMTNLNREMPPMFRALLEAACKPGMSKREAGTLPSFVDYAELYTYDNLAWLVFENLLVADDRYTHPQAKRGFVSTDHGDLWRHDNCQRWISPKHVVQFAQPQLAKQFRQLMWDMDSLGTPPEWTPGTPPHGLPRVLTMIMAGGGDWPGITNHAELKAALEEVAAEHSMQTRVVSLTAGASLGSHLDTIARSGVLVGRHSPLMAGSMLLPPGGMVLELLPYKWEWAGLSKLYYNITQSVGDIHHFAWRPQHYKWAKFKNASDLRYHTWTPEECEAYECLNKLGKADIIADIPTIIALFRDKLAAVLRGAPIDALREPWPKAV